MKYLALLFVLLVALPAQAQNAPETARRSPKKAFALSLLLPGLGHRYAHAGSWAGAASGFTLAEAGFWVGTLAADWRHDAAVEDYETLAAARAGAQIEGKDRAFFLNLAAFSSSDEFRATKLRNRAWDEVGYVDDPAYQWKWQTEADFERFGDLRNEADDFRNRRTLFIAALVTNRLVAGFTAARAASRVNRAAPALSVAIAPSSAGSATPVATVRLRLP